MLVRFLIMFFTLEVAAAAGVGGWYLGLLANVAVTIFAAVLVTRRRLWASIGATTLWRSWWALAALAPLALDAVSWALPARLVREDPGFLLWGVTLLLVGVNEELISRGVILSRLEVAYRPLLAVTITAALFGLQHLSAFALTSREAGDILGNVALSGIYGFALAAFQWRFRWIWPLILVHALADFVTLLAAEPLSDGLIVAAQVTMLALGLVLLRWRVPPVDADLPRTHDAGVRTRLTGRAPLPDGGRDGRNQDAR